LYHPDRVARFYRYPFRDAASYRAAAAQIEFPEERRAALIAALRQRNPRSPAMERLAKPGAVAVLTGQQVGLFGGPAYTVYKALHAVKLAEWLTANGQPAVPVFWLATEDHDFAEVSHVWVHDGENRPAKVQVAQTSGARPVGEVRLDSPPLSQLRDAMNGLPFVDEAARLVEESYRPGATMGEAFGALLNRLLAGFDILQVDPMLPEFRRLAAPALRAALESGAELSARLLERGQELTAAGYHAQVHMEAHTSLVFLLEDGKRLALRRHGDGYYASGRAFSARELADRADSLSPNALLRPVVQDSMFPTAAYIGGAAEIAYLAQSEVIYRAVLGRMPVAVPRTGFTILDARSEKLMARYGLSLPDFFHGEGALREKISAKLIPPQLAGALGEAALAVDGALHRLRAEMTGFDGSLVRALDKSARKIRYQVEKLGRKAGRESLARDARASRDAASLYGSIYPEGHLQERLYSILPFLARHGLDLPGRIYEAIELDCPDHRVLTP
jgi:bacillithiol biosynthesis cysteine-adding enzyme BshC